MICYECHNAPICVIYADIVKHAGSAQISVNTCNYRKWIYENYRKNEINIAETNKTVKKEIDPFTGKPKVDRDKINELSRKKSEEKKLVTQKTKRAKTKIEPVATPLNLDHICPGCGGTTFKNDASKCDTCGADICSCCATVNSDNNELLCPDCWIKL